MKIRAFLQHPFRLQRGFIAAAREEVSECASTLCHRRKGIEGTHAPELRKVLDRYLRLTDPDPQPAAGKPRARKVWIECKRTIDEKRAGVQFMNHICERMASPGQRHGLILAYLYRFAG